MTENLGLKLFVKKITEDEIIRPHLNGLFPKNSVDSATFAVNFYTSIGLGAITEDLRAFIKDAPNLLL